MCGVATLTEGIKCMGVIYIAAAFFYAYMALLYLDWMNGSILLTVLLPRCVTFVMALRTDTKQARKRFYMANFICSVCWVGIFIVRCFVHFFDDQHMKVVSGLEWAIFLGVMTLQVYFTSAS